MPAIKSKLNPRAPEFEVNRKFMEAQVAELRERTARAAMGGSEVSRARRMRPRVRMRRARLVREWLPAQQRLVTRARPPGRRHPRRVRSRRRMRPRPLPDDARLRPDHAGARPRRASASDGVDAGAGAPSQHPRTCPGRKVEMASAAKDAPFGHLDVLGHDGQPSQWTATLPAPDTRNPRRRTSETAEPKASPGETRPCRSRLA